MVQCPNCGERMNLKATVKYWLEEDRWDFWGPKGKRWILCRTLRDSHDGKTMTEYVHFRVKIGNDEQHRLAIIPGIIPGK